MINNEINLDFKLKSFSLSLPSDFSFPASIFF